MISDHPDPESQHDQQENPEEPAHLASESQAATPLQRAVVATTGKRQAFSNIRRQLTEADLSSPGVTRMLLEELERAESQCEIAEGYRDRYHEADVQAAVLRERLKTQTAMEIAFGVGVSVGSAIIGLAPYFWDVKGTGPIALGVGVILVVGASVTRIVRQ